MTYLTESGTADSFRLSANYQAGLARYAERAALTEACKQERADTYFLLMDAQTCWAMAATRMLQWLFWRTH